MMIESKLKLLVMLLQIALDNGDKDTANRYVGEIGIELNRVIEEIRRME